MVTISIKIFIIYVIQIITFNMIPKVTYVTINRVFFITNGLYTDATEKLKEISVIYVGLLTNN